MQHPNSPNSNIASNSNTDANSNTGNSGTSAKDALNLHLKGIKGLKEVDILIRSKFESDAQLLSQISQYLFDLGGKRIRPSLCLMSAAALEFDTSDTKLTQIASGIELIHMATLLHDDIIDKSLLRRRSESPLVRYGMPNTLLAGDFLLTRAFSLCAHLDQFIIDCTERACIELTEGEILETPLNESTHTMESSLNIASKKTASLFWLATISAAHISGSSTEVREAMGNFGRNLGIAFQILDDVLDVVADENLLGKKSGVDLKERKPSLVNVLWLASKSPLSAELLKPAKDGEDEKFVAAALSELRSSAVIDQAKSIAIQFADKARASLQIIRSSGKSNSALDGLESLIDYCLERME